MPKTSTDINENEAAKFDANDSTRVKCSFIPTSWSHKAGRTQSVSESFFHAFHGLWVGLKEQRNVRIHLSVACLVLIMAVLFKVDLQDWVSLIVAMGFVLCAEFINTALEYLVDISADGEYHSSARAAKDTAAAAVLIASLVATIIGVIVFGPRLLILYRQVLH
jgi:undecaprenol kinase